MALDNKLFVGNGSHGESTTSDIILVVDTSFLSALSNRHLWAYQVIGMLENLAHARNTHWEWRAPPGVIRQYEHFLQNETLENGFNIPLALHSIDELLDVPKNVELSFYRGTQDLARKIWVESPEGKRQAFEQDPRWAGKTDIMVIEFGAGIAQSGAQVYVASSDFKDVIRPLEARAEEFARLGWNITPVGPSVINNKYWGINGRQVPIAATVTNTVLSDLAGMKDSNSFYYAVVLERKVKSGDVEFDAGVGVVKKEYIGRPFELPQDYSSIAEKYRLIPAIRVDSSQREKMGKKIANAHRNWNAPNLIVIEKSLPFFPTLVRAGAGKYIPPTNVPIYRADLDFLNYQSNSAFARANYRLISMRR